MHLYISLTSLGQKQSQLLFYSYYIQLFQSNMQQYSYFFVPFVPFGQPLAALPQTNCLLMPVLSYPAVVATILPHQAPFDLHSLEAGPQAQQTPPDQEMRSTPQSSQRYMTQPILPLALQAESFVANLNAFKYPKKNAQSNLINQIFSYISIPSKSSTTVLKIVCKSESKCEAYFELMRNLKRQNKKYINRSYLRDLLVMEKSHIIHGILQKIKIENGVSKQQLKNILRRLVLAFLRQKCILTILTSNKLDRFAIRQHLQRRREVLDYLCYHLKVAETE